MVTRAKQKSDIIETILSSLHIHVRVTLRISRYRSTRYCLVVRSPYGSQLICNAVKGLKHSRCVSRKLSANAEYYFKKGELVHALCVSGSLDRARRPVRLTLWVLGPSLRIIVIMIGCAGLHLIQSVIEWCGRGWGALVCSMHTNGTH